MELVKHKDSQFVKDLLQGEPFLAGQMGLHRVMQKTDLQAKVGLGFQTAHQKVAAAQAVGAMLAQLEANPSEANYNLTAETLKGFSYEHPENVIGPLEYWIQKEQEMKAMAQEQLAIEQAAVQQQASQIQLQAQQIQFDQQLKKDEQAFKQQIDMMKAEAEIREKDADTAKKIAEAEKLRVEADAARSVGAETTVLV